MRMKLAACKGESVTGKVAIFGGNQRKNWRYNFNCIYILYIVH